MNSRREILQAHYNRLLRKLGTWTGLVALGLSLIVPGVVNAGQVTARSATLSDSSSNASSVSYDVRYTAASALSSNGFKGIRFQFCSNSPLYNTSCTAIGGTFVRGTGISVQTVNGGAFTNSYSCATSGTTDVLCTNATGNTIAASDLVRFKLTGFTNPTTATSVEYYVRIIVCNDTTCTVGAGSNIDNGGLAVDVVQTLSVTATVQEDLTFCVAVTVTTPCSSITGSTVTLAPNPMTTGGNSHGTAQMAASTNGTSGDVITYNATSFTDTTSDTITAAPSGGAVTNAGGTEQFGFTLRAQTSGNLNGV
ncbi:MAG TPA: hypothetical protein VLF67_05345, partial [Candidatus Saccharimonas sp.]|nr:hypothetical protein [Candidatus Saccharimonas sp.]